MKNYSKFYAIVDEHDDNYILSHGTATLFYKNKKDAENACGYRGTVMPVEIKFIPNKKEKEKK